MRLRTVQKRRPFPKESEVQENGHRHNRGRLSLVACQSGREFAARVDEHLQDIMPSENGHADSALRNTTELRFANGEIKNIISENVRGDDLYVIQCMDDPIRREHADPDERRTINDNLMSLLTAVNASWQSDPDSITAVIPQFPYSRQERKKTREGITARLVASAIEDAGANRVLTLDIHAEAIQGFFQRAILEDLHASHEIISFFRDKLAPERLVVVAPDTGSADKARFYSGKFECGFALVDKARDYSKKSSIESMRLVGDVEDKQVLLPDDMVGTGGTLINACKLLREAGAREIYLACSLPFFNGRAIEKLDAAHAEGLFDFIVGTDAVYHGENFSKEHPWYREVSVARLFARVIFNINRKLSVSRLLK